MPSLATLQAFAATVESNDHVGAIHILAAMSDGHSDTHPSKCGALVAQRLVRA